jgi:hypothetical protein
MHDETFPEAGAAVQVRLRGPLFKSLENWRRSQPKILPRSEALRILIERALAPCQSRRRRHLASSREAS